MFTDLYFFRKINEPYVTEFRELAMFHNVRNSRLFAATISAVPFILHHIYLHGDITDSSMEVSDTAITLTLPASNEMS